MKKEVLVAVSGYFDPIHVGHLEYLQLASVIKPDIFANGGDRSLEEIPETAVMKKYNIKMVDGLGDKIRSSSDLTGIGK